MIHLVYTAFVVASVPFWYQKEKIYEEEMLLGTGELSSYSILQDIIRAKEPYDTLWSTVITFNSRSEKWLNGPLLEVNSDEVQHTVIICSGLRLNWRIGNKCKTKPVPLFSLNGKTRTNLHKAKTHFRFDLIVTFRATCKQLCRPLLQRKWKTITSQLMRLLAGSKGFIRLCVSRSLQSWWAF